MSLNINLIDLEPLGPTVVQNVKRCYSALSLYCRKGDPEYLLELNDALNVLRGASDVVTEYIQSKMALTDTFTQNRKTRSDQLNEDVIAWKKRQPLTRESKNYGSWQAEEAQLLVYLQAGFAENKALQESWEQVATQGKALGLLMDWQTEVTKFVIKHLNEFMRKGE